ncbi:MAG: hypothetical protein JXR83_18405 [Deltaproteobacteria bacterium]|nr:hypothetical protein [Deltaproteobacteria bacterium]
MSELFERWQRLVDRVRDGEIAQAAELAAVAPLFIEAEVDGYPGLLPRLRALASRDQRLPIGDMVLGPADDAAVSWPCPPDQVASAMARTAAAVAVLGCAAQAAAAGEAEAWLAAGLTADLCAAAASTTLRSVHGRAPMPTLELAGRWQLIACQGVPVVDVVSPYVRDAAGAIDAFAASAQRAVRDDDDRYRLLPDLLAFDPRLAGERAAAEETCGVRRLAPGATLVQPRAVDVGAADVRVRNALHALRRSGTQVVVVESDSGLIARLLRTAAAPPERIAVVTGGTGAGELLLPARVEHIAGHRLPADPGAGDLLERCLPRELRVVRAPCLVSIPACADLRPEVAQALRSERGALDDGAYHALLGVALGLDRRAAPAGAVPVTCAVAAPVAAGRVAAALWQACALETPRGSRGKVTTRLRDGRHR